MQTNDLKYSLLDKLISVRDLSLLQQVNEIIGNVDVNSSVIKVTDAQRQMLKASEEDIMEGRIITNEDLDAEEDKWLNE
jgi:hypothetical protein